MKRTNITFLLAASLCAAPSFADEVQSGVQHPGNFPAADARPAVQAPRAGNDEILSGTPNTGVFAPVPFQREPTAPQPQAPYAGTDEIMSGVMHPGAFPDMAPRERTMAGRWPGAQQAN